ncbi:MAG: NADH-quinone oxidoreductase subunit K [Bdellovibrionales bacterium]|nr:NADH-quinone oxidoreductase subunit K [Bdellovibrionales bacterium]
MIIFKAITLGMIYFTGFYLLLRQSLLRNLIGILVLSNGINLLIFFTGGNVKGAPAFIPKDSSSLQGYYADPLPQALILTAIVIGFGFFAFFLMLSLKVYEKLGSDDMDSIEENQ